MKLIDKRIFVESSALKCTTVNCAVTIKSKGAWETWQILNGLS